MSARAAARLESLGFEQIYRYTPGKEDWMANGWPVEGEFAEEATAEDLARRDVPTCRSLDKADALRRRMETSGYQICVVVNDSGVVLGQVRAEAIPEGEDVKAADVMDCGPRTFRLHAKPDRILEYLRDKDEEDALATLSDGRLLGLLLRSDLEAHVKYPH